MQISIKYEKITFCNQKFGRRKSISATKIWSQIVSAIKNLVAKSQFLRPNILSQKVTFCDQSKLKYYVLQNCKIFNQLFVLCFKNAIASKLISEWSKRLIIYLLRIQIFKDLQTKMKFKEFEALLINHYRVIYNKKRENYKIFKIFSL